MVRNRVQSLLSSHRRVQGQWAHRLGAGRPSEEPGSPGMLPAVPSRTAAAGGRLS